MRGGNSSAEDVGGFTNHDPSATPEKSQALYERWRAKCPVAHSEAFEGFFLLNDYSDVRNAAKDWEAFSSGNGVFQPPLPNRTRVIEADPPVHTREGESLKEVLNVDTYRAFDGLVRTEVNQLIDAFIGDGRVGLIAAPASRFP